MLKALSMFANQIISATGLFQTDLLALQRILKKTELKIELRSLTHCEQNSKSIYFSSVDADDLKNISDFLSKTELSNFPEVRTDLYTKQERLFIVALIAKLEKWTKEDLSEFTLFLSQLNTAKIELILFSSSFAKMSDDHLEEFLGILKNSKLFGLTLVAEEDEKSIRAEMFDINLPDTEIKLGRISKNSTKTIDILTDFTNASRLRNLLKDNVNRSILPNCGIS